MKDHSRDPIAPNGVWIAGLTRRVGLIGFPVEHSLSPVFQQAAFDALHLDVCYELWSTPSAEMPARMAGLRAPDILGANITVPNKQRAFDLVDDVSELARRAGAVNTIVKDGGRLRGENTDVAGFLTPLRGRDVPLTTMHAVILGAGGAARAVAVALQSAGCKRVTVANRTLSRAVSLVAELGDGFDAAGLEDLNLADVELLVNATSIGWEGDRSPLSTETLDRLPSSALVYDLTYRETPLLRLASIRGNLTLDGLEMLVAQGAESFRLWTGQEPPVELMLAAARRAANDR